MSRPSLHPEARALLDMLAARGVPPTDTLTVDEARRGYRERCAFTQPPKPAVGEIRALAAPGLGGPIALRLYRPLGECAAPLPALAYFHGGGWTIGDLDTHDTLCRELANGAGIAVVSVDYRLAPEHPFPAAVDDAVAATCWLRGHAASLGLDPARLAVGGDSAGGNLAAVVALAERDHGRPLAFQLLVYPATDMRCAAPSHETNGEGFLLTAATVRWYRGHYVPEPAHWADWRASPLLHPELAALPPALVLTAGYDPLRDEGAAYAEALTAAGNRASLAVFERQLHGFALMGGVLDEARDAVALCAAALKRALRG